LRRSSAKTTLSVLIRSNGTLDFLPGLVLPLVGLESFSSFELASISAIAVGTEPSLVLRFFVTFESAGPWLSPEWCAFLPFIRDKTAVWGCSKEFATTSARDACADGWCDRAPIPGLDTGSSSSSSSSSSSLEGAQTRLLVKNKQGRLLRVITHN
jgi:hypothetical protein